MTKNETDFESWFDMLQTALSEAGVSFHDADAVRDDYEAGKDLYDVSAEIQAEYED